MADDINHKNDQELHGTIDHKDPEPIETIDQTVINESDVGHDEKVLEPLELDIKPSKLKLKTKESIKSEKLSHKEKKKFKKEVIN